MEVLGESLLIALMLGAVIGAALLIWRVVEARRERREARELRAIVRRYE